jgi:hypothetical protein
MDPIDDPKLSELLKEWQVPGAPPSLDARVLGPRKHWWSFLLTGSIRIPVPVMVAIAALLLVMAAALLRERTPAPVAQSINLADFQPVRDPNVRIIRSNHEAK